MEWLFLRISDLGKSDTQYYVDKELASDKGISFSQLISEKDTTEL
jgi:uncharacterized iron-regulated protein